MDSNQTINKDLKNVKRSKIFDKQLSYYIQISVMLGVIISLVLIQSQAISYKSSEYVYKTSELFETTAQTDRAVYDVAVVFGGADKMQELSTEYGKSKLGVYMLSTSEDQKEVEKYKYNELSKRVQAKPASIICVYQTDSKDWYIFYPASLWNAIPEPQGYFNHVHDLLQKMDLANSYANIVNYTYDLYHDLNELVTSEANKIIQTEKRQEFIRDSAFYFISIVTLQVLIGIAIQIVQKDYVYSSNAQLLSHINDAIDEDARKEKEKTDRKIKSFKKQNNNQSNLNSQISRDNYGVGQARETSENLEKPDIPEWFKYKCLTGEVNNRLQGIAEQLDNSEISSNTARLIDRLQELDNIVSQRYSNDKKAPGFVEKFYRSYFVMLMNLVEQVERYINENDVQKTRSYNEGLELYEAITNGIIKKLKQSSVDTIRISVDAVKRGAMLDGLIENKQDDEAVDKAEETSKEETSKLEESETDKNEADELNNSDDKSGGKLDDSDEKSDEKEVKDNQEIQSTDKIEEEETDKNDEQSQQLQ